MATNRKVIQGEDIVVLVDGKELLHSDTHSLSVTPEFKEYVTFHTNGKANAPGIVDWSIDVSGLMVIDPDVENTSSPLEVLTHILEKTPIEVIIKIPDTATTTRMFKGGGWFGGWTMEGKASENATYSCSITQNGALEPYTGVEPPQGSPVAPSAPKTTPKTEDK